MSPVAEPTLRFERSLLPGRAGLVIGCDEVGRGALAGPVAVGLSVVEVKTSSRVPKGLRDSKLLSEQRREELAPVAAAWSLMSAVGYASASEIDRLGISACLGLAGVRALAELQHAGVDVEACTVVLDGNWDWLSAAASGTLWGGVPLAEAARAGFDPVPLRPSRLAVTTRIKADRDCASVAAASVVAKVARDRLMVGHDGEHPMYGWVRNKGYASEEHRDAIVEHGPSGLHRHTWLSRVLAPDARGAAPGQVEFDFADSAPGGTAA
ncbi:ribonuclease HII [Herbiconiux moechotypicola]|uniref:Ribonuclease n=1 Tax=Herbiconiux moechotypicola TaxID=637393 RepID=A0ABP5QCX4_9MICO|nr:ribonuclease HII [Herbiconiux moechotypicola]MCS5729744.1 ribonuclease HII [Herbiconiux moechotypicola]